MPTARPTFRIKAWWVAWAPDAMTDPKLTLGPSDPAIRRGEKRLVKVPLNMPNIEIYRTAELLGVYINTKPEQFPYAVEVHTQRLYTDIQHAREEHYNRLNRQREIEAYAAEQVEQRAQRVPAPTAEQTARVLLQGLAPDFYKQIDAGYAFYFTAAQHRYIINPSTRDIIRLDADAPRGLCIYLTQPAVQENVYDWATGIYMFLRGAEEDFNKIANEFRRLRSGGRYETIGGDA